MVSGYLTLIGSVMSTALIILFLIESRRGVRYANRIRSSFDARMERGCVRFAHWWNHVAAGTVRIYIHRTAQYVLDWFLRLVSMAAHRLERLHRRHTRIIRSAERARGDSSYLQSVAAHKAETKLTDVERAALKERSINGESHEER